MIQLDRRLALSITEAASVLGVSEGLIRKNMKIVPHLRFGERILIPVDALRSWLQARIEGERASGESSNDAGGQG